MNKIFVDFNSLFGLINSSDYTVSMVFKTSMGAVVS